MKTNKKYEYPYNLIRDILYPYDCNVDIPDEVMNVPDLIPTLNYIISTISEPYDEVILLRYKDNMTYASIDKKFNKAAKWSHNAVDRCIKHIGRTRHLLLTGIQKRIKDERDRSIELEELKTTCLHSHAFDNINSLDLPKHMIAKLNCMGIYVIDDIFKFSAEDLLNLRPINMDILSKIYDQLIKKGYNILKDAIPKQYTAISPDIWLDMPLKDTELGHISRLWMYHTPRDLANKTYYDILKISGIGIRKANAICELFEKYGVTISKEINDDSDIEHLGISPQTVTWLKFEGIDTVGKLTNVTRDELTKYRHMNKQAVDSIEQKLKKYGYKLKD